MDTIDTGPGRPGLGHVLRAPWRRGVEPLVQRWLVACYGAGEPHQADYYRCKTCARLVTWKAIKRGGCQCGGVKLAPALLRWWDKARLLLLPWSVQR